MSAKAVGFLELNIAGFDNAIASVKKTMVALAGIFISFKAANYIKDSIKDAINFGNEMYHAAQRIGQFDPGMLLIAQKALQNAGLGAEEARSQINLLVESGRPLSTLFGGARDYAMALNNATVSYGSQAAVLSKSAEELSKVFETIESVGSKLQTFFLAMTARFTTPLMAALNYLDSFDLAGLGADFGDGITKAVSFLVGMVMNGNIGEMLGLSLRVGFSMATDYLTDRLADIFEKFKKFKFDSNVFKGLTSIFKGIGEIIAAAIKTAIANALGGVRVMGIPLLSESSARGMRSEAALSGRLGDKMIQKGADQLEAGGGFFGGLGGFIKGITTPTEEATERLKELGAAALKTGEEFLAAAAGEKAKTKLVQSALGQQEPYKVIADSISAIGGGGGFIQSSMSIEAREAMKHTLALQEMVRQQEETNKLLAGGQGDQPMKK